MSLLNHRILRYIDEVARQGSIRSAGRQLNVAPSSINRQLISLENALGVNLFERQSRRMVPTSVGELLIAYARNNSLAERRMLEELDAIKGGMVTRCTIATVAGVAGDLLAHALSRHRNANPGATFSVRVTTAERVAAAVAANEIDIGFAFDMPRLARTTVAASVQTPCGAVVAKNHPLAGHERVHLHEITRYPLLLPRAGVTVRNSLENAAWRAGVRLLPALESDDFELLHRFTAYDDGVAVLNRVDVLHASADGRCAFVPLVDIEGFTQELSVMHCAQARPSAATTPDARARTDSRS